MGLRFDFGRKIALVILKYLLADRKVVNTEAHARTFSIIKENTYKNGFLMFSGGVERDQ